VSYPQIPNKKKIKLMIEKNSYQAEEPKIKVNPKVLSYQM